MNANLPERWILREVDKSLEQGVITEGAQTKPTGGTRVSELTWRG